MTFEEYKKTVLPGRRVCFDPVESTGRRFGPKMYGTAMHFLTATGTEYAVKYDNGMIGKVSENNVQFFSLEAAN